MELVGEMLADRVAEPPLLTDREVMPSSRDSVGIVLLTTVTEHWSERSEHEALICTVPTSWAVTMPSWLTDAIASSVELHRIVCSSAFQGRTTAVSFAVCPVLIVNSLVESSICFAETELETSCVSS